MHDLLNYVLWTGTDALRSHVLARHKSSITVAALQRVGTAFRTDVVPQTFHARTFGQKKGAPVSAPGECIAGILRF